MSLEHTAEALEIYEINHEQLTGCLTNSYLCRLPRGYRWTHSHGGGYLRGQGL